MFRVILLPLLLALPAQLTAQVGILRGGCPNFPGFSATGGGAPRVGNANFRIAPLPPCQSTEVAVEVLGSLPDMPLSLPVGLACEAGCTLVGSVPIIVLTNVRGSFPAPIPNNPSLVGKSIWYQHGCQRPQHSRYPGCLVFNGGLSIKIMP